MAHACATDVLVAGAGPVGLTAAAELRRRGVSCRIIDRLPARLPFATNSPWRPASPPEAGWRPAPCSPPTPRQRPTGCRPTATAPASSPASTRPGSPRPSSSARTANSAPASSRPPRRRCAPTWRPPSPRPNKADPLTR
ncbi:FAD-dependent monooxygenase [Streptomyces sp. ISL-94]|uniref:FAD-dependent monooxygenase n=1 Tax=Streptomyces sp. ISL-94 TaxID=2819190 RepID=UPI0035B11187